VESNIGEQDFIYLLLLFLTRMLQNTFGEKLGSFGFNPFVMLVVDLLHEFELGIWKSIFTQLIRILYAAAPAGRLVTELDRRKDSPL
jgi:hypothetical protein